MRMGFKDIWFCNFLMGKGYEVLDYVCYDKKKKRYEYFFEIKDKKKLKELTLEFDRSPEAEILNRQTRLLNMTKH